MKDKELDPLQAREIGYQEAAKIDAIINDLLTKYPIEKKNTLIWQILCRTVGSSLRIIERATNNNKE